MSFLNKLFGSKAAPKPATRKTEKAVVKKAAKVIAKKPAGKTAKPARK